MTRPLTRNLRNLVHRHDDCGEEFVGDGLHVLDGGLQSVPHLLVAHGLLGSHVVGQLAVGGTHEVDPEFERCPAFGSCAANGHLGECDNVDPRNGVTGCD